MPPIDFKIGCDPEFGLLDEKSKLVVPDLPNTNIVGLDGSGVIAEIRPKENEDPKVVVKNIKSALQDITFQKVINCKWKAGNMAGRHPIGGHIHFGIREFIDKKSSVTPDDEVDFNLYNKFEYICNKFITKPLDHYLACYMSLIEDAREARVRQKRQYGQLSNIRTPAHGIEYRTLGSWLISPEISEAVLSLAKVIMYEIVNNDLKSMDNIWARDFAEAFHLRDKDKIKTLYIEIKSKIQSCELYGDFKKKFEILDDLIESNKSWKSSTDMRNSWGIKATKLEVATLEEIWQ